MKVALNANELESVELSWLCIKPMLHAVRGKDMQTKLEMYHQLNEAQKGLYLFYSYHNHTDTSMEFYWFSAHHINELKSWERIRQAMLFFKADALIEVLDEIQRFIQERSMLNKTISPMDLERDSFLLNEVNQLHEKYSRCSAIAIQQMNEYILDHRAEFLEPDL